MQATSDSSAAELQSVQQRVLELRERVVQDTQVSAGLTSKSFSILSLPYGIKSVKAKLIALVVDCEQCAGLHTRILCSLHVYSWK